MAQTNDTPLCGERIPSSKSAICEATTGHSTAFPQSTSIEQYLSIATHLCLSQRLNACDFEFTRKADSNLNSRTPLGKSLWLRSQLSELFRER